MIFAQMLKMRDKLSRRRNILLEDEEKPFLEHLDDLRKMLMRIAITLLVSVTLCFTFNGWFFKVVQYPMERAGLASAQERNLPEGLNLEQWKQIHTAARGASVLQGPGRELFMAKAVPDAKLRAYAEAMLIYHTADLLTAEQQSPYMEEAMKLLPAPLQAVALEAGRGILKAKPASSLEALKPVIETEAFAPAETFMLSMKLSSFAGVIVSFPLLFYFLLEFILPGLSPRERKLLWPALTIGFGLFLTGVVFAYFFVIPNALEFFHEYSRDLNIRDGWRIGNYISFVTSFCLIFGVSFELPVVVMILVKLGLLTSSTMRRTRAWAIVIITVAAAILTTTGDVFTLSLLAVPMIVMYECCIWMAVALEKKEAREEAEEAERDMARRAALFGVASVPASRPGSAADQEETMASSLPAGSSIVTDATGKPTAEQDPYHWDGHPHHPDPDKPTPDEEYAQYMREHAHLFPAGETHPESTPVEERGVTLEPTRTEAPVVEVPAVTPDPAPSPESPEPPATESSAAPELSSGTAPEASADPSADPSAEPSPPEQPQDPSGT